MSTHVSDESPLIPPPSYLICLKTTDNIFDNLPSLAPPTSSELRDELERYLSSDPEHTTDALKWWYDRRAVYPTLSRMALDYLSIPGEQVPPLRCLCSVLTTQNCSDLCRCRAYLQPR